MRGGPDSSPVAGSEGGPGLLREDNDRASVVFRRRIRHPIEDVWEAITDPRKLEIWFMTKVTGDISPGGRIEMEHGSGVRATGRVLECLRPRTYEYEWNLPPGPQNPVGESSIVRWELTAAGSETLLVLTHRKLTRPTAEVFARGISVLLDRMSAMLDGAPLPNPPWLPPPATSRPPPN